MTNSVDLLENMWNNEDGDLPFKPSLNEQQVLDCITMIVDSNEITYELKQKIEQWIKFNKWCNKFEQGDYQNWVFTVYSKIEKKINQVSKT